MSRITPISYTDEDGNQHEHTGVFAWLIALLVVGFVAIMLLFIALIMLSPILIPLGIGIFIGKLF